MLQKTAKYIALLGKRINKKVDLHNAKTVTLISGSSQKQMPFSNVKNLNHKSRGKISLERCGPIAIRYRWIPVS